VSAVVGAGVGHRETDGVEHYLHVTEKRNRKRRKRGMATILSEMGHSITNAQRVRKFRQAASAVRNRGRETGGFQ
jgi:hypothetical protein